MKRRSFFQTIAALIASVGLRPAAAKPIEFEHVEAIEPKAAPFVMMHVGVRGCLKRAALMVGNPPFMSTVSRYQFRRLDGSEFGPGSRMECGSCGGVFMAARHGIYTNEAEPKLAPMPRGG